jgi:hypothetical protein
MPRPIRLLAAQAANLFNYKSVAERLQLHPDTVKSYVQLLETVFLVHRLPAWRPASTTNRLRQASCRHHRDGRHQSATAEQIRAFGAACRIRTDDLSLTRRLL